MATARDTIEESLLLKPIDDIRLTWRVLVEEMKKLGFIAGPVVAVTRSQYLLHVISVMMVGHLGELSLSSTSIATSLSIVSDFSLLSGISSALETLCGRAYGVQQYKKFGTQTYTAVYAVMLLALIETSIVSTTVFANRHVFGYLFTNEKEVVDYVTKITPLLCLHIIMDSLQGVARGVGWQYLGAYANLAAFYLVGIPVSVLLGFFTSLRGQCFWIGILSGVTIQAILLSVVTIFTNYEKQATKARERLFEEE